MTKSERSVAWIASEIGFANPLELAALEVLCTIPARQRAGYIREAIGPILALPSARAKPLLETIEGVIRGLSVKQLAKDLHFHPKTLGYRRARVAELTRLEPWSPAERFHLILAFLLWRLASDDLPKVGSRFWRAGAHA